MTIENLSTLFSSPDFQLNLTNLSVNIFLSALMAFILSRIYIRFARSISNRELFSKNFIILAMTTTLIITIIKSSIALSLGLVGALSIVRFRAAIKEPEELTYLFLTIGIGLGFGAGQSIITIIAILIIIVLLVINSKYLDYRSKRDYYNFIVSTGEKGNIKIEEIVKELSENCKTVRLKRFDETDKALEALFFVEVSGFEDLNKSKEKLQSLSDKLKITFMDNKEFI